MLRAVLTCPSQRAWSLFAMALFVICFAVSAITPSFQSPDEVDHVKRAYLLTTGQFVLDTPPGQSSGGMVDSGLLAYMSGYENIPFKRERKLFSDDDHEEQNISWSGVGEYSTAPGTGYYFPLI